MSSQPDRLKAVGLALIFAFALFGCSGSNSSIRRRNQLTAQSFNEQCTLCHRSGSIADIEALHASESSASLSTEITGVAVDDGTGKVTIGFKIFDSANNLIPVAGVAENDIRFTLAKLAPDDGSVGLAELHQHHGGQRGR